jgi:hypothetical protein
MSSLIIREAIHPRMIITPTFHGLLRRVDTSDQLLPLYISSVLRYLDLTYFTINSHSHRRVLFVTQFQFVLVNHILTIGRDCTYFLRALVLRREGDT